MDLCQTDAWVSTEILHFNDPQMSWGISGPSTPNPATNTVGPRTVLHLIDTAGMQSKRITGTRQVNDSEALREQEIAGQHTPRPEVEMYRRVRTMTKNCAGHSAGAQS